MQPNLKKILRALSLDIRHTLEGAYDSTGIFLPGDLETRLNALGVWRDRPAKPLAELPHLSSEDKAARQVIDAYIAYRAEADVLRADAVAEFVRESAYNWANRMLALRCMEARGLIDEVILQKEIYGGRSLVHNRLARKNPEACAGPDEGLFAVLFLEFKERARELPELFAPASPAIALHPSLPALKRCLALLSGTQKGSGQELATDEVFSAPDALGWAYQYWNTEEKDRVFEKVRSQKGAKIEGADIIPATQLYTEPYMVKFLIQNSLGATWMGLHPDSTLSEGWEYYVTDADRAPAELKAMEEITLLDPACGSGHFLLEAFDMFFQMYTEETTLTPNPSSVLRAGQRVEAIAAAVLNHNLYGIDIDARAVQIAAASLWMKAKEYAPDLKPESLTSFHQHLVATNIRLPKGKDHLKAFLAKHPEAAPLQPALEVIFEGLENVHELGSLVQIEEPVEKELRYLREKYASVTKRGIQANLFEPTVVQGELPLGVESYEQWKSQILHLLEKHFIAEAELQDSQQRFFAESANNSLLILDILLHKYDVLVLNPPYLGFRKLNVDHLKRLKNIYPNTYQDLYTSFIERCIRQLKPMGYIGILTLSTWLTLKDFSPARNKIFENVRIDALALLGTKTFLELSNTNAMGFCMITLTPKSFQSRFSIFYDCSLFQDKDSALLSQIKNRDFIRRHLSEFENVPGTPIIFKAPNAILNAFSVNEAFNSKCKTYQGLVTGNNDRYIRFVWESPPDNWNNRWYPCTRGGDYRRWRGNFYACVDWENSGCRLKNYFGKNGKLLSRPQNTSIYFHEGLTWTTQTSYGFSVRKVDKGLVIQQAGPLAVPNNGQDLMFLLGILNCRVLDFLFNLIQPKAGFGEGYLEKLPLPTLSKIEMQYIGLLAERCVQIARIQESKDIDSAFYSVNLICNESTLKQRFKSLWIDEIAYCAVRHTFEGEIEKLVFNGYSLDDQNREVIYERVGEPVGWLPYLTSYQQLPQPKGFETINIKLSENPTVIDTTIEDMNGIKSKAWLLAANLDEINSGSNYEEDNNQLENNDEIDITDPQSLKNYPTETFLESLSYKLSINPISLYWIILEGMEKGLCRNAHAEIAFLSDLFSQFILQMLGHLWPKQVEAGEPVPDGADPDGIILLTAGLAESALLERVRVRLTAEFPGGNATALEREFEEIMGESLEKWLSSGFFKRHISQFKKRPIAWQLSSRPVGSTGGRGKKKSVSKAPAFACLVYYQKLDHNTLTAMQSQYIRPLRQSYETELRTLDNNAFLTPDQSGRRIQLEAWINELKDFESRLEQCAREGFASQALSQIAAKEPLDRWISRNRLAASSATHAEFETQEMRYDPDINDGVRVNIAPLQKYGLLAADVLDAKDIEKAIADRAEWRADERRWCRDGKLPQPGWWKQ